MRFWLVLAVLLPFAAQAEMPAAGVYLTERGFGELRVSQKGEFSIEVIGTNGHSCGLSGTLEASGLGETNTSDGDICQIKLNAVDGGYAVEVAEGSAEFCRTYCGARAFFTHTYYKVEKQCIPGSIDFAIDSFAVTATADEPAYIDKEVTPLLSQCARTMSDEQKSEAARITALARAHAGDKAGCVAALKAQAPLYTLTDAAILEEYSYAPSDALNMLARAKKLRDTAALCGVAAAGAQ